MPNTPLSSELSQVIIHVNLQEFAPLLWRHLAALGMGLPGIGSSGLAVSLKDFQQLCPFVLEVKSLRMRDFITRWKP
jgi:hypothetical protein